MTFLNLQQLGRLSSRVQGFFGETLHVAFLFSQLFVSGIRVLC